MFFFRNFAKTKSKNTPPRNICTTEIVTVELNKLKGKKVKPAVELDRREGWGLFMLYYRKDKRTGLLQKIIFDDEGIAAADQVMREFTMRQMEELAAISALKYELDMKDELLLMKSEARAEGYSEGYTEGRMEAIIETARKLKDMGIPINQISEASGIPIEEIEGL